MVWVSGVEPWEKLNASGRKAMYYAWSGERERTYIDETETARYQCMYGHLVYKLDPDQLETYKQIDAFFAKCKTSYERMWVNEWSRRLGKDFMTWVIFREHSRVVKDDILYYATAYEKDINDILLPIVRIVDKDCPPEWRLKPRRSESQLYDPVTKTEIRLIGLDVNPDGIRGNRAGKICITEASYVKRLEDAETAYNPMLVEDDKIERFYNSTPGKSVAHRWHTVIVPRAKKSKGFSLRILDDCKRFRKSQIAAAYEEFGGYDSTKSQREYRCIHIGEETEMVIPEAAMAMPKICVDSYERPFYAAAYVGTDPGMVDLTGSVWAYHDFKHDMLVFEKAWGEPRKNTDEIAAVHLQAEKDLWPELEFCKDGKMHKNPYKRTCDHDLRLIEDLKRFYGLEFEPAEKSQGLQAMINAFRIRVQQRKIRILPDASDLAIHMEAAIWNKNRTKLEHVSEDLGHFDILMAAIYLNRIVDVNLNPFPQYQIATEQYHSTKPLKRPGSGWKYTRTKSGGIIQ